jgi:hypothetical protein
MYVNHLSGHQVYSSHTKVTHDVVVFNEVGRRGAVGSGIHEETYFSVREGGHFLRGTFFGGFK